MIRRILRKIGLKSAANKHASENWVLVTCSNETRDLILKTGDPVRYGSIYLALDDIKKRNIAGSFAECGVWQGTTSKFIHGVDPDRPFYLFDTFEGFDNRDLGSSQDDRFKDTSLDKVLEKIGNTKNIIVRKGYFPDTTTGLENEIFSFVMIDFDKYNPTRAALNFFYNKMSRGGYVFVHDYNSPESDWACFRALNSFLEDKPEMPVAIPDTWGSALFRKC